MMKAARLHKGEKQLRMEEVPVPEPSGGQVLVRVAGAGICHSDLHALDGLFDELMPLQVVTPGHEIAGRVEAIGPSVCDLKVGDPVTVVVGWGCGHCEWCVSGHEQICLQGDEAGATLDGGFAEFVLVPHRRHLIHLGDLDLMEATPFGCAALCSYAAVKRVRPHLSGGAAAVVIGAGGLGQFGIQFARLLTGASVIAVDPNDQKLARAGELGAQYGIKSGVKAADQIAELTDGRGAGAVIDFVGTDETLALASKAVGRRGIVALLGLRGGSVPFNFFSMAPEAVLTTVVASSVLDLQEVVRIAQAEKIESRVKTYPLEAINDALDDLRAGRVDGRAVVVP